jgi:nitroreductase
MSDFLELCKRRQSCRGFSDKPVEHEKLVRCAEAGRLCHSACNAQPWSFVVVESPDKVAAVAECGKQLGQNAWLSTARAFIVVLEEHAVLSPTISCFLDSQYYAKFDCGSAAAYICLEAADQGLGSCIIGIYDRKKICGLLNLPVETRFGSLIALGYPASDAVRSKKRKEFDSVTRFV